MGEFLQIAHSYIRPFKDVSMNFTEPHPLTTLYRELPADLDTPVSVFLRLTGRGPSFLLESVTGAEQVARYSFIGVDPSEIFVLRGRELEVYQDGKTETLHADEGMQPFELFREVLASYGGKPAHPDLPRFYGGLVGYLGYDSVRFFEPAVDQPPHPVYPDAMLMHAGTIVAFDHAFDRLLLIASATDKDEASARLDQLEALLSEPIPRPAGAQSVEDFSLQSNMTRSTYTGSVRALQEHIAAGDIFQGVLSQRLFGTTTAQPFEIYRRLRRLNPSPYMFYFDFGDAATLQPFRLIGSSPEMHVRLENGIASLRPIAGTRPRGATPTEDLALEAELLDDPKERAEHLMLIDLARNDLGRVCDYGTVRVPEQFSVERYSHVMHIVSHTEGRLRKGLDAFDLIRATFPAGTVTGAPKIRAMQLIRGLEPEPRGPYAGAVGYFSYDGNADTCIALRTLVMHGPEFSIQAGAGIVADSDPDREYEETLAKARAVAEAVRSAETPEPFRAAQTIEMGGEPL
ncbi:MAG TPA: anthranilate synthase component I [Anaerolineales bacterium]|nr:anthranilate synthase component I [Anaerolineales bacterium]